MANYTSRDNFVAPAPHPRAEIIEVERNLPTAPIVEPMPLSGYVDRSVGFTIATGPLAGATAFVVVLIGVSAFGVPVLSVAALLLALAGFSIVWLIAYVAHTLISADGALFVHTLSAWRYLRAEQKERHARYREVSRHE